MHIAALALTWLASLAPLLLERFGVLEFAAGPGGAAPRLGLCALVWLALAGAPRWREIPFDGRHWWGGALAAVPVLCLACLLDGAGSPAGKAPWAAGSFAAVAVALSALASDLAAGRTPARRVHGALWLATSLGLPLLWVAFHWGTRVAPAATPAFLDFLCSCSPLRWAFEVAREGASARSWIGAAAFLSALCALAAAQTRTPGGRIGAAGGALLDSESTGSRGPGVPGP
jgi:hypothetical protein